MTTDLMRPGLMTTVDGTTGTVQAAPMRGVAGDGTVTAAAATRVPAGPRRRRMGPGGVAANTLSHTPHPPARPGLVTSSTTARVVPSTLAGLDGAVVSPTASDVLKAAARFGPSPWDSLAEESPLPRLYVTPGALIATRTSARQLVRAAELEQVRRIAAVNVGARYGAADAAYSVVSRQPSVWGELPGRTPGYGPVAHSLASRTASMWGELPADSPGWSSARRVTGFSAKSRVNMTRALASLDWTPLHALAESGRVPAMVTLTWPGDWETVAPTGKAVKRHVRMWLRRYRRVWGESLMGVWKLEFQGRGAPHIHIFMYPPHGRAPGRGAGAGLSFHHWLSVVWADIVDHPDPAEYQKHLAAGTAVDVDTALKCTDPRRLITYFSKHGQYRDKEYQHIVPEPWRESGAGPGRFWGYWGLRHADVPVELAGDDYLLATRILRRYAARSRIRACNVAGQPCPGQVHESACGWRYVRPMAAVKALRRDVDESTGEVIWRKHRRRARVRRFTSGAGFMLVNDAPALAHQLARAIAVCGDRQ
jgi:hypothetical protein